MTQKLNAPFTGWHIAAILVAFLGTVIAVNILMAVIATASFGGTVVDNSYVASQKFNGWLRQARAQDAMGWREQITLDGKRRIVLRLFDYGEAAGNAEGRALTRAAISAVASHPLGRAPEQTISFKEIGPGRYLAVAPLPRGRWIVHFTVISANRDKRVIKELR